MKDKIVYFSIGAVVVVFSVIMIDLIAGKPTTAQMDFKNPIFDSVMIKGKLIVGNKENYILLEGDKEKTNLIIDSKGSAVLILTTSEGSSISLSKSINGIPEMGAVLQQNQKAFGDLESSLMLLEKNGKGKVIRSTD